MIVSDIRLVYMKSALPDAICECLVVIACRRQALVLCKILELKIGNDG